jgi:hypothetical protein
VDRASVEDQGYSFHLVVDHASEGQGYSGHRFEVGHGTDHSAKHDHWGSAGVCSACWSQERGCCDLEQVTARDPLGDHCAFQEADLEVRFLGVAGRCDLVVAVQRMGEAAQGDLKGTFVDRHPVGSGRGGYIGPFITLVTIFSSKPKETYPAVIILMQHPD